jgi:hypothetical protein
MSKRNAYVLGALFGLAFWALFISLAMGATTPSTGVFVRSSCTSITNPVANQTWCLNTSTGQLSVFNGSSYTVITGTTGNVSQGPITTSGLTQATGKLLGRGSASTGAIEEITLGTNLALAGTTLNASGGGGITRTLIETFTVGSDQTSITFAATLDGNTDEVYEIEGNLVNNAGADIDVTLQPNAVSTNQQSYVRSADRTNLLMVNSSIGNTTKFGNVWVAIVAKTGVGPRRFVTHSISDGSAQHAILTWFGGGFWTDTSTNITSLKILSSSANGIGAGSVFNLYKRPLNSMFWY